MGEKLQKSQLNITGTEKRSQQKECSFSLTFPFCWLLFSLPVMFSCDSYSLLLSILDLAFIIVILCCLLVDFLFADVNFNECYVCFHRWSSVVKRPLKNSINSALLRVSSNRYSNKTAVSILRKSRQLTE